MPADPNKTAATLILALGKAKGKASEPAPDEDDEEIDLDEAALMSASEDVLKAIESKDAKAFAAAFKAASEACKYAE